MKRLPSVADMVRLAPERAPTTLINHGGNRATMESEADCSDAADLTDQAS